MNRIWVDCIHGTWLSPCPICKEENNNNLESLHGSAISNAKQHSSHDRIDHHTSTNEGKNEGLPGLTTSALQ